MNAARAFQDGLAAEEKAPTRPEESKLLQLFSLCLASQMTDARCPRCTEKQVGVVDIIHAGGHGDRYLVTGVHRLRLHKVCNPRCLVISDDGRLTIDALRSVAGNVGAAAPRESEKPAGRPATDLFQKSTAALRAPFLETTDQVPKMLLPLQVTTVTGL
ncbi:hypothetical protein BHE74_00036416 [Ensete ventricosum]|nr:hypothetical protein GW17_00035647 [Ensete ventricosum]RWW56838.1 hypothetical protein BHE74_00036416 [Ensete ventricosum]RZS10961.1 hypothetical protein BHM03_00042240 [Ensete ventricosum]